MHVFKNFLLLLCLLPCLATCQESGDTADVDESIRSRRAINQLKKGVLVVLLPTYSRKIEELERLVAQPGLREPDRKSLQKQLVQTRMDRDSFRLRLVDALTAHYEFSSFLLAADTSALKIVKDPEGPWYLNKNQQPDPGIRPEGKSVLFLRYGTSISQETTGLEALLVADEKFVDLKSPFPYWARLNAVGKIIFVKMFNPNRSAHRDMAKTVVRLNKRLKSFHQKHGNF